MSYISYNGDLLLNLLITSVLEMSRSWHMYLLELRYLLYLNFWKCP